MFNILLEDAKGSAAARNHAIGPAPKHRLPVDGIDLGRKLGPEPTAGPGFQRVHEVGKRVLGRHSEQHMHMLWLSVDLYQPSAPCLNPFLRQSVEPVKHSLRQHPPPVFGDDNQVIVQRVNAVELGV